jgi:drug/metabolite transporter (DMT)-like permease
LRSIPHKYLVHLALFTVAAIYAANYSFAKWAMPDYISSYAFIVLRVGFGAIIFMTYHLLFVKEKVKSLKDYRDLAICGFFGVGLNMSAFFKGLSLTSAINASVLMLLAPVFVVIFSAIGYRRKIKPAVFVGVAIAFVGAALLVNGNKFSINSGNWLGDVLIMVNATSYAFYLYYVARLLKKYKAITITAYIFLFGFVYVLPIGVQDLTLVQWTSLPTKALFSMFYVVLCTTVLAYILNAWGLQKSNSTLVGSYIYLQPVLATTIAIALGMETITLQKAMFAILILLGLWLVNRSK